MSTSDRDLWQSLDERAGTMPPAAEERLGLGGDVDRRRFLQLMGASLALAGSGGCFRQPAETVVPQVRRPQNRVPGQPLYFATAIPLLGFGTGVLVESNDGRPTKVEGNPLHPASLGATDAVQQATLLGLYDPDRSQVVTNGGQIRPWSALLAAVRAALEGQRERRGAGLRILTETVTSPTLASRLRELLADFPRARWVAWEPAGRDGARAGARQAFGEDVDARYRVDKASVILSLDGDLFTSGPGHVRYAREFGRGRRALGERDTMNRLWVAESMPTITGASADRRIVLRAHDVEPFARAVAAGLNVPGTRGPRAGSEAAGVGAEVIAALVRDLRAHRGSSLVVPGELQPASVHALAHAMNDALGSVGKTVEYTDPVETAPGIQADPLRTLVEEMDAGGVDVLLVLGGNPVLTAPADLRFAERLAKVPLRLHLGLHEDETATLCHWHVPEAHYLESWGDVRAYDGTAAIIQPLIAPLYAGRTALGLLAALTGDERSDYELVRAQWQRQGLGSDFEAFWQRALHDGVVAGTTLPARRPRLQDDWAAAPAPAAAADGGLEVVFRPDAHILDGRFANNGWLMELPRPITKLTWDNAALLAPATAARLGVRNEDVVEVTYRERSVQTPVWIVPGHAPESVTLQLGYGRTRGGAVASGAGVDVYPLRTADAPFLGRGATLRPIGRRYPLSTTQGHQRMEGRALIRAATLEEYRAHPGFAHEAGHGGAADASLYPPVAYSGHAWGMAIDLASCIGCQACVVACQAENNVPVVGKEEVARGREMHWIRVDRYFEGDEHDPAILHQPVPCMHCEHAPCEVVCPVNATVHSSEGLNDMVYNRCVGTRYCSNNCPYKVRRFNFFAHANWDVEVLKMAQNPDVTVRSRGVMEKCTYCVQRIEEARARAIVEGRPLRDGDVVTACQQVCPTEAIVFGDLNDPESRVAKRKAEERNYALLGELGTRPRTTYLAKIPQPGNGGRGMSVGASGHELPPVIQPGHTFGTVTDKISAVVLTQRTPRAWFVGFAIAFLLLQLLIVAFANLLFRGVGIWGINIPVGWGFDIVNFVWWIGIGHAGTLISAILLLLRQDWRTSINRFAEAMTLFAVACAGLYPLMHMGRPWFAYWLFPYPNTMGIWPNFRSPLVWDVFAVSTYATVSILFWYVGLIPDLATLRDRSPSRVGRSVYGMLAMGWRGSARHWQRYEMASLLLAGIATPLVVSVHTVVSFDFAVSVIPGWHATIFPPYFVAGAIYGGFAMVLTLAIPLRKLYGLEDFITLRHLNNMGRVLLATGLIVAYGYMMEAFMAWYSANPYEQFMIWNRFTGPYAVMYWTLLATNVVIPQALWFQRVRTTVPALFAVAMSINVGMWLERYVIVVTSLHRDFLPSSWGIYHGTQWDIAFFVGSIGLFLTLFLLFIRFLPMISIFEMRTLIAEEQAREEHA